MLNLEHLNKFLNTEYLGIRLVPIFKFEEFEVSDQYSQLFNRDLPDDCSSITSSTSGKKSDEMSDLTDKEVALYIFDFYKGKIIKNKEILYCYYKNQWNENIDDIFKQWFSVCDLNTRGNPKAKQVLVNGQTSKWAHYALQVKCLCIEKLESLDILNVQKDLLPFTDGYFDFKTNEFKHYSDDNVIYFTYKIGRKFPQKDQETLDEVKNTFLEIFDQNSVLLTEVFNCIARGLGNNVQDKVGLCLVGERNSAKGFIVKCLMSAFQGITGSIISNDLVTKKNSMESAERRNGIMKNFCENLLCISEEVNSKNALDGTIWKSIVSGGDKVSYRAAYGLLTEKVIRALYLITSNKTPTFDLSDARETMLLCNMPCKFYDVLPDDGIDRGFTIKKSDPAIKQKFENVKYIDAFTYFVLSHYSMNKPLYPLLSEMNREDFETCDNYVDNSDILHVTINKLYSINVLNLNKKLSTSEVHRKVTQLYPDASSQKIKTYLERKGVVQKKIQGFFYYYGISEIDLLGQ